MQIGAKMRAHELLKRARTFYRNCARFIAIARVYELVTSTETDTVIQDVQCDEDDLVPGGGTDDRGGGRGDEDNVRCSIVNKRCVIHLCDTKAIKVTSNSF